VFPKDNYSDMKVIPLSEGSFTIDKTKEFVPFAKGVDDLQQRSVGSLLVEIQPFVVITKKDIIILDCGLGFTDENDILQIHRNLIENDIDPMSVTKVLLSHLHKDHAGGISKFDKQLNRAFLSFPNATYYVNKSELALGLKKDNPSYKPEIIEILSQSDNVIFIENNGKIDGYISYELTAAHSPFHQVFWIEEDDQLFFYGADDAPQLQQMKSKFVAKYDFDGRKCMELRSKWWEEAQEKKWTLLFYHDIKTPSISF
jgi:glyoxylase-like metal-dependent hydrolase (beta-lactamase superfamily II)